MHPYRENTKRVWSAVAGTVDRRDLAPARRQGLRATLDLDHRRDETSRSTDRDSYLQQRLGASSPLLDYLYALQPEELASARKEAWAQGSSIEAAMEGHAQTTGSHQASASNQGVVTDNSKYQTLQTTDRSLGKASMRGPSSDNQQDEETQRDEEQNPSLSSSSASAKKTRKRPHYLSHEDRCQIIERVAGGEQQAALAREFGVTRAAVCHIQKHRFQILARPAAQPKIEEDAFAAGPAPDQQLVHELRSPSVLLLLTKLRDRRSDAATYRRATGRIIMILIENVLGQVDVRPVQVTTPSSQVTTGVERRQDLCGIKLGVEGYPFSVLFHQVEADAAKGYINVESVIDQHGSQQWRLDRMDVPASIASCKVLLFTATCSTGWREYEAIEALCGVGTLERNITLVAIVCASDGVVAISSRFPQVRIVTAAIDVCVDPLTESIVPGIGNFVARYNDDEMRV